MIASSFACVASDALGPAAEAHVAELTLFRTHARTHTDYAHTTLVHALALWRQPKLPHRSKSLECARGLFSFESETGGDFVDLAHTDIKIHCVNCHVMASSQVELALMYLDTLSVISASAIRGF